MGLRVIVVFVWRGRAYVPIQAQHESGIFTSVEPVLNVSLTTSALTLAMQSVLATGHPRLANPSSGDSHQRKDPVLSAAGARTLKEMMSTGGSYTVAWTDKEVRIDMSRLDKKGRWENDPAKVHILSPNAPLEEIVSIILNDANSRP